MSRITIDLDDATLARITAMASERRTSVEALVREEVEKLAAGLPGEVTAAAVSSKPEEWRGKLLELIDATDGDMGAEGWKRANAYDR